MSFQRKAILIYIILLLFLVKLDAFAIGGLEKPIKGSSSDCFIFNQYAVSVKASGQIGDIITVKKRTGENVNCNAKSQEVIITIDGTDSTETFVGVYNHFLFTDSGTGPDGRGIAIYDLRKKKMVYSAVYSPIAAPIIENNALIFYKDLYDLRYKEHRYCPDAEKWLQESGLDYGFEQKTKVDLNSMAEKAIGEIKCSERQ